MFGCGDWLNELLMGDLCVLVDVCMEDVVLWLDLLLLVFGYSLGVLVVFELVWVMMLEGLLFVGLLVLGCMLFVLVCCNVLVSVLFDDDFIVVM